MIDGSQVACAPAPAKLRQEAAAVHYATSACQAIARPSGRGVLPVWRTQGWLSPHLVAVVHVPAARLWRVRLLKYDDRPLAELARAGTVVDLVQLPHRFAAVLVKHDVLDAVQPWRVEVPTELIPRGRTDVWHHHGPQIDLHALATDLNHDWT